MNILIVPRFYRTNNSIVTAISYIEVVNEKGEKVNIENIENIFQDSLVVNNFTINSKPCFLKAFWQTSNTSVYSLESSIDDNDATYLSLDKTKVQETTNLIEKGILIYFDDSLKDYEIRINFFTHNENNQTFEEGYSYEKAFDVYSVNKNNELIFLENLPFFKNELQETLSFVEGKTAVFKVQNYREEPIFASVQNSISNATLVKNIFLRPEVLQAASSAHYLNGVTFYNGEDPYNLTITERSADYLSCKFTLSLNGETYNGEAFSIFSYGSASVVAYTFPASGTYTYYSGTITDQKQYGVYYVFDKKVPITSIQWNYYKTTTASLAAFGLDWSITINDEIHPKITKINYPEEKYAAVVKVDLSKNIHALVEKTTNKKLIRPLNTKVVPVLNVKKITITSSGKNGLFGLSFYGEKNRQYELFDLNAVGTNGLVSKGRVRLIDKKAKFEATASSVTSTVYPSQMAFSKTFKRYQGSVSCGWISASSVASNFTIVFDNEIPLSKISFIQTQSTAAFGNSFTVNFYDADDDIIFTKECLKNQAHIFDVEVE